MTYLHSAVTGEQNEYDREIGAENDSFRDSEPNQSTHFTHPKIVEFFTNKTKAPLMLNSNNSATANPYLDYITTFSVITKFNGCNSNIFLVIVVFSAVEHFIHRDVIRHTWASESPEAVKVLFLVGLANNRTIANLVNVEYKINGDILLVNITDTYDHLTLKSIAMLEWLPRNCANIAYVLKVDDDTLVNVPKLLDSLRHVANNHFIMGNIIAGAQPMRDRSSKWYTPTDLYPQATYPDYVSGSAYVISGDLIQDLYGSTRWVPFFWVEDIYITGLCAGKLNASLVHNSKFKSLTPTHDFCMIGRYLTVHRVKPKVLLKHWTWYSQNKQTCR
jgi:hypothetical protein